MAGSRPVGTMNPFLGHYLGRVEPLFLPAVGGYVLDFSAPCCAAHSIAIGLVPENRSVISAARVGRVCGAHTPSKGDHKEK